MNLTRRAAFAAPLVALASGAQAQAEWPKAQPIKVLIPFAPGGVPDIIARIVTPRMAEGLGQSFVIDNKPGAGGGLAGQLLSQAAPDGYTLLMGTVSTMAIVPAVNPALKYDPTSFAAIGLAAQSGTATQAATIMILFSLGATAPMLALAYGSRQALSRRRATLARLAELAKPVLGVVLLLVGFLILSGLDKVVETRLTDTMPPWLVNLTTRF